MKSIGIRTLALAACLSALSACEGGEEMKLAPAPASDETAKVQSVADEPKCAVIESKNWQGYIDKMPGIGAKPTLRVSGEIVLPTPGYTIALKEGRADRSAIPMQQLILDLTPPGGIVNQVLTTETVKYDGPAIAAQYKGVQIVCAGKQIAEITDISDVH